MPYHLKHQTPNTKHQRWQSYVLNRSINAVGRVCRFSSFIPSGSSLKLLSQLAKKPLQALSLLLFLLYSWHLYALPRDNNRSDAIMLPPAPFIMFASPHLSPYSFTNNSDGFGPTPTAPGFVYNKGFYNTQSYASNFPTTGANGLYFDLVLGGDANDLIWNTPITHEGITATVTKITANDSWVHEACSSVSVIPCEPQLEAKVFVRVTLNGPFADDTQINSDNPVPVSKPSLPQTFELVGRNRHNEEIVKYGFVLKHWFVHRGGREGNQSEQTAWCSAINYRMPKVEDLTNAKCRPNPRPRDDFPCRNGIDGALPQSSDYNTLLRHVDAGFITEWGSLLSNAGFKNDLYWTSDSDFFVDSGYGKVKNPNSNFVSSINYGMCVHP
ncbi:hypothetical protein A9G40_08945 [Gilliamella sp. Nev3-1]|nr:hypothetical protein A9G40_08945 [Gilliamella apicola]